MKVLIVGGAGYVGTPLTFRLWEAGHEVTVLDKLSFGAEGLIPLTQQPRFQLLAGDMRDAARVREAMRGQDAVCLLAAIVGEPACNRDKATAVSTNIDGSFTVLRAAREAQVSRFVFVSTCSNYGVAASDTLVTEDAPLQPLSTYSETKVRAEREILAAAGSAFHPTVLRLSTAFGVSPRMRFDLLVSDFALAALRQHKLVIYGPQFWRPFVHVADIAAAMERVLNSSPELVSGNVFNIGDNENNLQKQQLAQLVQRHVEGTEIEIVPGGTDPRSYRVDFSKAGRVLKFKTRWSVEEGVREAVQALRAGVWTDPQLPRYYN